MDNLEERWSGCLLIKYDVWPTALYFQYIRLFGEVEYGGDAGTGSVASASRKVGYAGTSRNPSLRRQWSADATTATIVATDTGHLYIWQYWEGQRILDRFRLLRLVRDFGGCSSVPRNTLISSKLEEYVGNEACAFHLWRG